MERFILPLFWASGPKTPGKGARFRAKPTPPRRRGFRSSPSLATARSSRPAPPGLRSGLLALLLGGTWAPGLAYADQSLSSTPSKPREARIYGGTQVPACAWPSAVSFGFCSGNLIHPRVILSAAHCNLENRARHAHFSGLHQEGTRKVEIKYCRSNPEFQGRFGQGTDWAYCVLKEPVNDIPFVPVLSECEFEYWQSYALEDQAVLVGFGRDESGTGGKKRAVQVPVHALDNNEVKVGGDGKAGCFGDSGGPAFIQLPDRSWRSMGIISYTHGDCGNSEFLTAVPNALAWLDENLAAEGIDITPCTDRNGQWTGGPQCGDFPLAPQLRICSPVTPRGGRIESCAAPFADPRANAIFPTLGGLPPRQPLSTRPTSVVLPAMEPTEEEEAQGCSLQGRAPTGLSWLGLLGLSFGLHLGRRRRQTLASQNKSSRL